ncbi:trigger factor [Pelagibius litoralis]|uniref:Trigger factor n=1 Tax=Pelagibius litoralis TaxID=374515 RepID=A0A967EWK7_9PROT|nr:trigger factor [Pelagibius litoralis]NIA67263.1 trigger factor [Pelagibius litoralis]
MQVTEVNSEGLKRDFKVVIGAKEIGEKVEARLREISTKVKIPGFRPGKAPIKLLKQRYGPSVMGEVLERAVTDSSAQALNERGLRPAVQPKIEIVSFDDGKDLEYSMAIELLPEIEPMDFSKIGLERLKIAVPEEDVAGALERLASSRKESKPLEKPRKAESGDILVMDFAGTVHGEALPGMAAEDHHLELGSNSFIEGFEEQLIGVDAGESREVQVTFPEAYGNEKLAGQPAVFQCTIKEIHEAVPAVLDDELAKSMGAESLEDLREKVKERLGADYDGLSRMRMKRVILDKLADAHDFGVPDSMVDLEFEAIWKQVEADREKGNVDPDDEGKDDEEVKTEYREIAERRVRLGLLLSEVGRINQIEVAQEEVNQALFQEAQRYPGQEQQVLEFYKSNPEALAQLRAPLFEDKVIDYIIDLAEVSEREVSPEQLREEEEKDAAEAEKPKKAAKKPAKKSAAKGTAKTKKTEAAEDAGAKAAGDEE